MARFKKSIGYVVVAGASAATALFGVAAIKDTQANRAREAVEAARERLSKVDAGQLAGVYRDVGHVMEPSVVHIVVKNAGKPGRRLTPFGQRDLREFFRERQGMPDLPDGFGDAPGDTPSPGGTGSGVVMETFGGGGFILTNNHVAGSATEIVVTLADGREIKNGKVVGTDPKTDLAVIKIEADDLIAAKWGDSSQLQRGDLVTAFGSPFGFVGSMTHGIVSALNRQAGILAAQQGYEQFIQVDCPINPGNSGGPLTNLRGEVVGINTAIASRTGSFSGIGFAIPSNQAKLVFEQLKSQGRVVRGWLGVSISDVAKFPDKAKSVGFDESRGVLIEETLAGGPAAGKLKAGDVVTQVNGSAVENTQALRNAIALMAPGAEAKMKVYRDRKYTEVAIKVAEQPADLMALAGQPNGGDRLQDQPVTAERLGLRLTDPKKSLLSRYNLEEGALVTEINPESLAAMNGLRAGDVITKVDDTVVSDAKSAEAALAKGDVTKGIRLYATSSTGSRMVYLRIGAGE